MTLAPLRAFPCRRDDQRPPRGRGRREGVGDPRIQPDPPLCGPGALPRPLPRAASAVGSLLSVAARVCTRAPPTPTSRQGSGGDPDPGFSLGLSWRGRAVGRSGGERGFAAQGVARSGLDRPPGRGGHSERQPEGILLATTRPSLGDPAPSPGPPPPGLSAAPGVLSPSMAGPKGAAAGAPDQPWCASPGFTSPRGFEQLGGWWPRAPTWD